jgi:hypothetical protein
MKCGGRCAALVTTPQKRMSVIALAYFAWTMTDIVICCVGDGAPIAINFSLA